MTKHDRWPVAVTAARLIAVTGLGIDAYVHVDLASTYSEAHAAIKEGLLFRVQAALAFSRRWH